VNRDNDASAEVDLLVGVRNGAWLDAQHFPPLDYHVPNLIPEGSTLLAGAPKIGKSWLVLNMALGVSAGGKVLGCVPVEPRPVFYLALEDGDRRMQSRCRTLLVDDPIPERFDYLTRLDPGTVLGTINQWVARHGGERPLVILDTLGKVMPPALQGESTYQRDYRVGGSLKRIVDLYPGAALVVNHHDRKADSEDFVDSVSGTHGLAGAADTVVVIARGRYDPSGLIRVTGRDVLEGEYAVRFTGSTWTLDGGTFDASAAKAREVRAKGNLGDRSLDILAFVAGHPDGARTADVQQKFGDDARMYLSRLVKAGRLYRPRRGFYALCNKGTVATPPVGGVDEGGDE
jgi:hypothetical protein